MEAPATVRLPGGALVGGRRCGAALVRSLNGSDEAFLAEAGSAMLPAPRATELLARLVLRLGHRQPGIDALRALSVGDREALLLNVLRLSVGPRLDCCVDCPVCGERLDLDCDLHQVLLTPYERWQPTYEESVATDDGRWRVSFRLPTGTDQEEIAQLALADTARAAAELLRRCLLDLDPDVDAGEPPASLADAISRRMAELDPQAEVELTSTCPGCGTAIVAPFDALDFLTRMAAGGRAALIGEVDLLARAYHWSEDQILAVPRERRREYVEAALGTATA